MSKSSSNAISNNTSNVTSKPIDLKSPWGKAQKTQPGLYVEDGVLKLGGKKFYGIGTNYYDGPLRNYINPMNGNPTRGIEWIASQELPFIRARFSAWGAEGMDAFWNNRAEFFGNFDRFVAQCEKSHVGIIATLVWTPNQYIEEGETMAEFFQNTNGKNYKKMLTFIEAIVTRYKNSPAIWGWEIGNEFNLDVDLNTRPVTVGLTADILADFYRDIAARIRKWDGTNRIISTGNSQNRQVSWNLMHGNGWTMDTIEQQREMTKHWDTPDMSVTSIHVYNRTQIVDGKQVSVSDYLSTLVGFCKEMKKPLYIGEYCDDEMNNLDRTEEVLKESLEKFRVLHEAIMANDIQLSTLWIYWDQVDTYIHPNGHKYSQYYGYMISKATEGNRQYVKDGKQDLNAYWSRMTSVVDA